MKPRIALITPDYPPDTGGLAVSVYRIAQALAGRGLTLLVVVIRFKNYGNRQPAIQRDKQGDWSVLELNLNRRNLEAPTACGFFALPGMEQAYCFLRHFLTGWQPDVIHSFALYPLGVLGALVASELKRPLVLGIRGNDIIVSIFKPEYTGHAQLALRHASVIAPVASDLGEYCRFLEPDVSERLHVIANGITIPTVTPRRHPGAARGTVQYVTLCKPRPKKNLDLLLHAFLRLHTHHRKTQLVIVGSLRPEDRARISRLGLGHVIALTGALSHDAGLALLAAADVVVIPSVFEGCANAMLEAMALGRTIIASKVGGALDFLRHDYNALLFEPLDEPALVKLLRRALSVSLRRRLQAKVVRAVRSTAMEADDWLKAYQTALQKGPRHG